MMRIIGLGTLSVGGGGRGVRKAPEHLGTGEWVVACHDGDRVKETYVRKRVAKAPTDTDNGVRNGEKNGTSNGEKNGEKTENAS
jgi:hypothetical protein